MQAIVERLLTLARVETLTNRDVAVTVRLDEIVRRAVSDLAPQSAGRNLTVTVDTTPIVVTGDPDRLLEAVTNVMANAVAYNVPEGAITVSMRERDGMGEVAVTDTGVGISPTDLALVFDPFFRADYARTRDAGGAGLGLTLTRSIVERHGGRVECRSEPQRGSTFTIALPVADSAADIAAAPPADMESSRPGVSTRRTHG
jgi:two-component system sensor histidine kinase SenX3